MANEGGPALDELDIAGVMRLLPHRYPFLLVDRIHSIDGDDSAIGVKNVTVNEEFFPGHFPGTPLMPAVLMIEALTQIAALLLFERESAPPNVQAYLRGVDNAKFRRQVVPGDQLRLEVTLGKERPPLVRARHHELAPRARGDGEAALRAPRQGQGQRALVVPARPVARR